MVSPYQSFIGAEQASNNNSDGKGLMASAGAVPQISARKKRILHVEFDRSLLTTRHALLETAGFEVISCFSAMAAREVSTGCPYFDLFLMGHAASLSERTDLITWIRAQFPGIAIVVLRSRDTDGSPAGDALSVAEPDQLLKTIVDVLKVR